MSSAVTSALQQPTEKVSPHIYLIEIVKIIAHPHAIWKIIQRLFQTNALLIFLSCQPPQLDKLYSNINMELRGNESAVLTSYGQFVQMAAEHLGINLVRKWVFCIKLKILFHYIRTQINIPKSHGDKICFVKYSWCFKFLQRRNHKTGEQTLDRSQVCSHLQKTQSSVWNKDVFPTHKCC